ncbi:hypothetical protein [Blastopirellula marina]|uniref:Uncharacterized protein n=1 Tax=Blastopirellula marina DSM 3645 TaxID=314230 RepID=A3ZSD3_9BACT|nr:hypothetical protein [Blastopirellula marina]EAQ80593.1 hypothetical protein DSM3645_14645 [Blastopirellula marina DSM 3645]
MTDPLVLTKEIVRQFLADHDSVDLDEYSEINADAAKLLRKKDGSLSLEITRLSDEAAGHLSKHIGGLCLGSLSFATDNSIKSLSRHCGELSFGALKEISDSAAKYASRHVGELRFAGLTKLSATSASWLGKHCGELVIEVTSEAELNPEVAAGLSKHRGNLFLSFPELSLEAALHLQSHFDGELTLACGNLSDAVIEALANRVGELSLMISELSDEGARLLKQHTGDLAIHASDGLAFSATAIAP